VETATTELEFFDHGNIESELLRANGGDVAAGASAENDQIELLRRGIRHLSIYSR
jgi:hypothetical protein